MDGSNDTLVSTDATAPETALAISPTGKSRDCSRAREENAHAHSGSDVKPVIKRSQ